MLAVNSMTRNILHCNRWERKGKAEEIQISIDSLQTSARVLWQGETSGLLNLHWVQFTLLRDYICSSYLFVTTLGTAWQTASNTLVHSINTHRLAKMQFIKTYQLNYLMANMMWILQRYLILCYEFSLFPHWKISR